MSTESNVTPYLCCVVHCVDTGYSQTKQTMDGGHSGVSIPRNVESPVNKKNSILFYEINELAVVIYEASRLNTSSWHYSFVP